MKRRRSGVDLASIWARISVLIAQIGSLIHPTALMEKAAAPACCSQIVSKSAASTSSTQCASAIARESLPSGGSASTRQRDRLRGFKVLNPDYTQKEGRRELFESFYERSQSGSPPRIAL